MSDKKAELEKKKQKREENMQKNVVRHQALWTAWRENSIEIDKQLLVLSTAAVGLLVFIHDELKGAWEKFFLICASVLFIITIIMLLRAFHTSREYIGSVLNENDKNNLEKIDKENKLNAKSKKLEKYSFRTFVTAVIFTGLMMLFKLGILEVILRFYRCFLN
ncbi:MAG: hypothetical protein K8953_05795 [Proteobacteria bacterium]|nr:hypothetical protein [Pseudomonadota bacterium]